LQRELSEAAEPLYKNVGPLMKQYIAHEQEERESLQDKMQTVAELVRIADTAAPLGARVAARYKVVFAQVPPELGWQSHRADFEERYFKMYLGQRAKMRYLRWRALAGHRWPGEKEAVCGRNQSCHVAASILLLREKPDERELLLWRL